MQKNPKRFENLLIIIAALLIILFVGNVMGWLIIFNQ